MTTAAPATRPGTFQRRIGPFSGVMLVAGSMIGSGIFIVSAEIGRDTGGSGWLLAVWLLSGLMTLLGALSYAELAAMMPQAGGQYVFLREGYSPLFGFLYGWTSFLVIQTGTIAAVAVAFAKFLGVLVPALGTNTDPGSAAVLYRHEFNPPLVFTLPLPWLAEPLTVFKRGEFTITNGQLIGVAAIAWLTFWNLFGIQGGKFVQNVLTVAKIGGLALVIVVGLTVAANHAAVQANAADPWGGAKETARFAEVRRLVPDAGWLLVALMVAGGAMVGALFSSDAWNNVTFTAGEVEEPQRTLPRSLMLGTGIVVSLYLLANLAYLASLPLHGDPNGTGPFERGISHARDERVGTAVLELVSPNFGAQVMAIAIMISTFGCANGLVLMGARLYYAMARDGLFFSRVGRLNRFGVPAAGLVAQGLWASVLVFTGTYGELLDYVIFAALLFYALTVIGLFVLRVRRPDAPRPYRVVGYPLLPALYVVLCVAVMLDLLIVKPVFTWPGLLLVLTGVPVYFLWKPRGARVA
jgi:APA family basic amino acid/polyamine antiporter